MTTDIEKFQNIAKSFRILYVEDDTSIRDSMGYYLGRFFLEVVTAKDGLQGLEYYKKEKFDIVITDLSMPHMDGLKMLEKIKEINKDQNVLITTAYSETNYMFGAIRLGIDGYMLKPFDYEQLNHELYKIVYKLKKFEENEQYKKHLQQMVEEKTSELSHNYEKTLLSMVEMIEDRDTYTAGHSKRIAKYSVMIAQEMGYTKEECDKLYQAGILHDIGKVATPDAVLLNPKSLNEIEYKLIKEHASVGYKLLSNIPMFKELAEIMHAHHERYDGDGYPRGLRGEEIIPLSRIMIVADAFDAMTTNRIYKGRKSIQEAIEELISLKSVQFHPEVVDKAILVLKNVIVDDNINQLPKTELEAERFAYFYKDKLANVYNQSYLDVVLIKNSYENEFRYMTLLFLNNFSEYNKKNGWDSGNNLLQNCATSLKSFFEKSQIFRVFGDDFVALSKQKLDIQSLKRELDNLVKDTVVSFKMKEIDLNETKIETISQIEYV